MLIFQRYDYFLRAVLYYLNNGVHSVKFDEENLKVVVGTHGLTFSNFDDRNYGYDIPSSNVHNNNEALNEIKIENEIHSNNNKVDDDNDEILIPIPHIMNHVIPLNQLYNNDNKVIPSKLATSDQMDIIKLNRFLNNIKKQKNEKKISAFERQG